MSKMFVAIYNHEYGNTVRAFSTIELCNQWKDKIANKYWSYQFMSDDVKPENNIGNEYFKRMSDYFGYCESFEIIENLTIETTL